MNVGRVAGRSFSGATNVGMGSGCARAAGAPGGAVGTATGALGATGTGGPAGGNIDGGSAMGEDGAAS